MNEGGNYTILPSASGHQSSMAELTNPSKLLDRMDMSLRKGRHDNKGNVIEIEKPLLNELGISDIRAVVESIVNQPSILAKITKEEMREVGTITAESLIRLLMTRSFDYDIDPKHKNAIRSQIMSIAMNPVHMVLTRAREGDDKRFWKGTQSEQRSVVVEERPQKSSWFNPFNKK